MINTGTAFVLAGAVLAGGLAARGAAWLDARIECMLDHGIAVAWTLRPPPSACRSLRFEALALLLPPGIAALGRTMAESLAAAVLCAALLVCGRIDWRHKVLPDVVVLPLLIVGLITAATFQAMIGIAEAVAGIAIGWCLAKVIGGVGRLYGGGMGNGDAKLLAAVGAWLGPLDVCIILSASALVMLPFAAFRPKSSFPFGPAIAGTTLTWLAVGLFGAAAS